MCSPVQNRLLIARTFADTNFALFSQASTLSYTGHSFTGGVDWRPVPELSLGISGDAGGTMHAFRNDTTLSSARVPKRFGFGTVFGGISGLLLSANAEWHGWSALNGLAESEIKAVDGWDWGVGAEVRAPSLFGQEFPLRLGYRHRILPFEVNTVECARDGLQSRPRDSGVARPLARRFLPHASESLGESRRRVGARMDSERRILPSPVKRRVA